MGQHLPRVAFHQKYLNICCVVMMTAHLEIIFQNKTGPQRKILASANNYLHTQMFVGFFLSFKKSLINVYYKRLRSEAQIGTIRQLNQSYKKVKQADPEGPYVSPDCQERRCMKLLMITARQGYSPNIAVILRRSS